MHSRIPRSRRFRGTAIAAAVAAAVLAPPGFAPISAQSAQDASRNGTPQQTYADWTRPSFPPQEFEERRRRLAETLETSGGGLLLVTSADGLSHGETFRQRDAFHYLTGLEVPNSALTLDARTGTAVLYLPETDFRFENPSRGNDFPGRPLRSDSTLRLWSGIASARPFAELSDSLRAWERAGRALRFDPGRGGALRRVETALIPQWDPDLLTLYHLQTTYPRLRLASAHADVARVRMVKSEAELEHIRRAAQVTADAIRTAAALIRDGVSERELEAAFEAACKRSGAQRVPFHPIVKSGPNSLWPWRILASHYDRRNRQMRDGELVILDVGCEIDGYVSDVGRTFPVSGRFSLGQRVLLDLERAVADAIREAVRPGATFPQITRQVLERIPPDHRKFMQTGSFFGHHIGLSTGDPSLADAPLEPGMVFTIEPWYYNHELGISVFTEDIVVVTPEGAELLTGSLARTSDELERLAGRPATASP